MPAILDLRPPEAPAGTDASVATRIDACRVSRVVRGGVRILTDVSVTIEPGSLVAVIGASGSGKTTLLETLAGLRSATSGQVLFDGWDLSRHRAAFRAAVGYVPQDDIIHRDLPVRATVRHAARLRLPHLDADALDGAVDRAIDALGLSDRAATVVGHLSGGQRKRVSIAVELLTQPRAFFLDEPTSGLDPGSARSLVATLQDLAASGSTVVMTTHQPDDVARCDAVIIMGAGGRLLFQGSLGAVLEHFGVSGIADVYPLLDGAAGPAGDVGATEAGTTGVPVDESATCSEGPGAGEPAVSIAPAPLWSQWRVLCRRNVDVLARNRLTVAIMLGAPVLVIAMFVVLFRPGAFNATGDPLAAIGVTYWLAFAAFFFGLTYGLLQVVTEVAVVRREHHVGLSVGAYMLSKVTVLVPVLAVVNVAMVAALQATGRLPDLGWLTTVSLVGLLILDAVAALALGLLASAAVADPAQATLALPMLCFPAVLFGGAVLPVRAMAAAGRAISVGMSDRWAFEAIGRVLRLPARFAGGDGATIVTEQHGRAFSGSAFWPGLAMVAFGAVFLAAAVAVLRRRVATR